MYKRTVSDREEEVAVAGVTGFKVEDGEVTDPETSTSFPSLREVQGWGLLIRPDAAFIPQLNIYGNQPYLLTINSRHGIEYCAAFKNACTFAWISFRRVQSCQCCQSIELEN